MRSEIRPSEAEMTSGSSRCQKAQDIADNTLFVATSNISTRTNNHIAPGDKQSLGANYLITGEPDADTSPQGRGERL